MHDDAQNLAGELLLDLEKKGIFFEINGENLKYRDAYGNFSKEYKLEVKKYKKEIIKILAKSLKQKNQTYIYNKSNEYPLTELQTAYIIGKTEAVDWGGVECQGYIEVKFSHFSTQEIIDAWKILVERHPMLRAEVKETGFQILDSSLLDYSTDIIDFNSITETLSSHKLNELREKFSKYTFDFRNPPLFKTTITKRPNGNYFHLLVDLIICDFSSVQLLISEMGKILKGVPLNEQKTSFPEYILKNKQLKNSLSWYRDREYWLNRLDDLSQIPNLPREGRAADNSTDFNGFYRFQEYIDLEVWKNIQKIAGNYGVTVSATLITLYGEIIARWSENKHFTLNLPIQDRLHSIDGINDIVGDFTVVNLLEVNFNKRIFFLDEIKRISKQLLNDLDHNSFSGIEVLRELNNNSQINNSLMPFVFTGVLKSETNVGKIEYGFSHTPQVWIDCQAVDISGDTNSTKGLVISWDIRKGTIKKDIVSDMFKTFVDTINHLGKNIRNWESKLETIIPFEKEKSLPCERSDTKKSFKKIQQNIVDYGQINPDKVAVIDAYGTTTYNDLLNDARKIAGYLQDNLIKEDSKPIAIKMKKSSIQIATVLGILIAGYTYLPIDIKQPLARQKKILERSSAIIEINEEKANAIINDPVYEMKACTAYDKNPIAYIIYTSGSTGEPKGVELSHSAVLNTIDAINGMYKIDENDIVLGIAELSFDLSVFDIFGILGSGGTLILPDSDRGPDASHWGELIQKFNVTLWNSVPAQAEMLDAFSSWKEKYPSIRNAFLSGDWINTSLPDRLRRIMPNAKIVSLGGATEGGIWSIYHNIDKIKDVPSILYGKALPRQWVGVVDDEFRVCPDYVPGQIAIGGFSLAQGYFGDEKLTREKFVYIERLKQKIYLTGDRGRYVKDGEIEFLGRLDNQIKINGHRIELAEVEAALRNISGIKDCCVIYKKQGQKGELVAFIKEDTIDFKNILQEAEKTKVELSPELINEFNLVLEEAICISVYRALSAVLKNYKLFDKDDIISVIEVKPQYEELLDRWLEILTKKGYLLNIDNQYQIIDFPQDNINHWDKLRKEPYTLIAPDFVSEYIQMHAENICELFKGAINPLIYLFPEGVTYNAEELYGKTAIARYLNESLALVIKSYLKYNNNINILEVGGGIGATTKQVIDKIENQDYKYEFTDISLFFLRAIRKQYPHIKTQLLNLDEFKIDDFGKFNIIIAAGVLNNTVNISDTIEKLKQMLSPDGLLLITEPVGEHIEITVSQAFMMPEHTDERKITKNCFLDEAGWNNVFETADLEMIKSLPLNTDAYSLFNQKLFIVRKKVNDCYKESLKMQLPKAMIPSKFISVKSFPLSSNGKIDRKALMETQSDFSTVEKKEKPKRNVNEPYTKIENQILKIMIDISGNNEISYEDNLLENRFDSLLLSQAAGKIVNEIPGAHNMRFDEILRVSLSKPTVVEIAKYIAMQENIGGSKQEIVSEPKLKKEILYNKILYVFEENKLFDNAFKDTNTCVKKISPNQIQKIVNDKKVENKYVLIENMDTSMALSGVSELLAQGISMNKVFLIDPNNAKATDLYLGDAVIIDGEPATIESWKGAILGEVKVYQSDSRNPYQIIAKELIDE